ncbi:hypothetical protein TNCV_3057971 [Trichonephila clavipes]|nr:hypothetical protein TNCV_3057971 [Trichonephila clavipes]
MRCHEWRKKSTQWVYGGVGVDHRSQEVFPQSRPLASPTNATGGIPSHRQDEKQFTDVFATLYQSNGLVIVSVAYPDESKEAFRHLDEQGQVRSIS